MNDVVMEIAIVIVGLAALGIFVGEVFRPRHQRRERAKRRARH